jgi:hypothetical protein
VRAKAAVSERATLLNFQKVDPSRAPFRGDANAVDDDSPPLRLMNK